MLVHKITGFVIATLFISSVLLVGCTMFNDGYPSVNCKVDDDCFGFQGEHCSGGLCMMIDAAPDSPPADAAVSVDANDGGDLDAGDSDAGDSDAGSVVDAGPDVDAAADDAGM